MNDYSNWVKMFTLPAYKCLLKLTKNKKTKNTSMKKKNLFFPQRNTSPNPRFFVYIRDFWRIDFLNNNLEQIVKKLTCSVILCGVVKCSVHFWKFTLYCKCNKPFLMGQHGDEGFFAQWVLTKQVACRASKTFFKNS